MGGAGWPRKEEAWRGEQGEEEAWRREQGEEEPWRGEQALVHKRGENEQDNNGMR